MQRRRGRGGRRRRRANDSGRRYVGRGAPLMSRGVGSCLGRAEGADECGLGWQRCRQQGLNPDPDPRASRAVASVCEDSLRRCTTRSGSTMAPRKRQNRTATASLTAGPRLRRCDGGLAPLRSLNSLKHAPPSPARSVCAWAATRVGCGSAPVRQDTGAARTKSGLVRWERAETADKPG